ncbi:MAG: TIGR03668 family PPOX class F420-dependent oxidoreductase [Chloroflexi bacterium]|nr:TIGR03668 family PPOX class F420-dependent oxidoreductase [Chloroflexota bacterium]
MARLSPAEAAFLEQRRLGHLATADAQARPHVVPVCFAVLADTLYVAIDEKPKRGAPTNLKRVRNVLANPRAAFVADVYDDLDWSRLGFVLIDGPARLVDDPDELTSALDRLRARYPQYATMALEDRPMLALDIAHVASWGALDEHVRR